MGVVYDCLWYWRQEYEGIPDPYIQRDNISSTNMSLLFNPATINAEADAPVMIDHDSPFIDVNTFFPEWNWFTNNAM